MGKKIDDGGNAFPFHAEAIKPELGMSLRDWFAGQALAGLLSIYEFAEDVGESDIARMSYAQADAMLEARGHD